MNETGQGVTQKESPVSKQLTIIEDRLGELSQTSETLGGRLGNILSQQQPTEATDSAKPSFESALEETLHGIKSRIETEISRLQNLTNRLTI